MVYLNKYLIGLLVRSEKFAKHTKAFIGYKESKKKNKFDFVKPRNIIFIVVSLIIIIGCMFTYSEGLNLGIDFKGGSTIEINSNEKISIANQYGFNIFFYNNFTPEIHSQNSNIFISKKFICGKTIRNNNTDLNHLFDSYKIYDHAHRLTPIKKSIEI